MGLTTVGFLIALLGLEQALPYRQEWSIHGDREIWRDIGHSVLYTSLGGNLAQIVFLYGFASALSRLGLAGGLGIWPVNSPLVAQLLIVMLLGDLLEAHRTAAVQSRGDSMTGHRRRHIAAYLFVISGDR
jgi:hypothetical protein